MNPRTYITLIHGTILTGKIVRKYIQKLLSAANGPLSLSLLHWKFSVIANIYSLQMCGIYISCSRKTRAALSSVTCEYLKRRGPDSFKAIYREFPGHRLQTASDASEAKISLIFNASVLSLRGDSVVEQPLEDPQTGSILCWNGEAWKINGAACKENDTKSVFDTLIQATKPKMTPSSDEETADAFMNAFRSISGPSAFAFYDGLNQKIFYGRDRLGRRSLLQRVDPDGNLLISSVCHPSASQTWTEVKAGWICILDLAKYANRDFHEAGIAECENIVDPPEECKQNHNGEISLEGLSFLVHAPRKVWRYCVNRDTETLHAIF